MRKNKRILVVVAHPDDEVLGCGGTIARHIEDGCEVALLVLTDGVGARGDDIVASNVRKLELQKSAQVLGISTYFQLNMPDNKLDSIPTLEVIEAIAPILTSIDPDIIYTHFLYDLNQDHSAVARAIQILTRPIFPIRVESILMMEVISSTEWSFSEKYPFSPNHFVVLDKHQIDLKLRALSCYASELRLPPHPRRIEHALVVAQYRGAQSGCEFAEAFMLLRSVN